jgi:hypothetical protein
MSYRVFITTGKGKNYTSVGSTPLKNRQSVISWIKRQPLGNDRTKVRVTNTTTKKVMVGSKLYFYHKLKPKNYYSTYNKQVKMFGY